MINWIRHHNYLCTCWNENKTCLTHCGAVVTQRWVYAHRRGITSTTTRYSDFPCCCFKNYDCMLMHRDRHQSRKVISKSCFLHVLNKWDLFAATKYIYVHVCEYVHDCKKSILSQRHNIYTTAIQNQNVLKIVHSPPPPLLPSYHGHTRSLVSATRPMTCFEHYQHKLTERRTLDDFQKLLVHVRAENISTNNSIGNTTLTCTMTSLKDKDIHVYEKQRCNSTTVVSIDFFKCTIKTSHLYTSLN